MTELVSHYFSPSVWFSPRHLLSLTFLSSSSTSDITLQLSSLLPACFSTLVCNTEPIVCLQVGLMSPTHHNEGATIWRAIACHILFYFEMSAWMSSLPFALPVFVLFFIGPSRYVPTFCFIFLLFLCIFSAAAHRSLQPRRSCCCHCISCVLCVKLEFSTHALWFWSVRYCLSCNILRIKLLISISGAVGLPFRSNSLNHFWRSWLQGSSMQAKHL